MNHDASILHFQIFMEPSGPVVMKKSSGQVRVAPLVQQEIEKKMAKQVATCKHF